MQKPNRLTGLNRMIRPGGSFGVFRKTFVVSMGFTFILLLLTGLGGLWQSHVTVHSSSSMKRLAASVSGRFFNDMIALEVPHMKRKEGSVFAGKRVLGYLSGLLLHVNPVEPKTLLAGEVPGLQRQMASASATAAGKGDPPPAAAEPSAANTKEAGQPQAEQPPKDGNSAAQPAPVPNADASGGAEPVKLSTQGRKVVFTYHSHPRESWVPELKVDSASKASDAATNITLVGKRLTEKLEEAGIGAVHSNKDYPTAVPSYNWNFSYKYSLQTVQEAFAANKDIKFLFDIHRDEAERKVTTATIDGKDYAKVYFIVGKKNEHWEQNEAFARKIHDMLEARYPGLSRGIWDKATGGHGEYNQSVSPNSMLIEVGGAYNTLEESYRTADILAQVIAELYWEAEKVNASATARR